ncbi:MAG: hypothetical protein HZA49_07325 [Planctomycetes bacterium]|nr:hypothetical protein [Planctomycetota bacterium]
MCCLYISYQWADNNQPGAFGINVIPQPRQVVHTKSPHCVLNNEWTIFVESTADETTRMAAELIAKDLSEIWGLKVASLVNDKALAAAEKSIILGVPKRDKVIDAIATKKAVALNRDLHPQGYKISITPGWPRSGKILLLADTSQGLFYAAQTFRQLITRDKADQIILPPVVIDDWPIFDYRGVQINLPGNNKTGYIKNLIHLLSYYKINILALQTASLTGDQITELTKEASAYQINLIGNISTIKLNNAHHICLKDWCGHLDRKPLGWIDSILKKQLFISKMPKTTIVMNTFEQDNNRTFSDYFQQIELFRNEGLDQVLCPQLTVPGNILPDIQAIHKNIYTAGQAGLRHLENNHRIMGLMLCSAPGEIITFPENIVEPTIFTAECGWIPDRADADKFSYSLTHSLFGINGSEAAEITNLLSSCNKLIRGNVTSEHLFPDPFKNEIYLDVPNFYGSLKKIKTISEEAQKKIASLQKKAQRSKETLDIWHYAAEKWLAFAERFLTSREISNKYQNLYDKRYILEYGPIKTDYQAIKKDYEELFDKTSKGFDTLKEEYQKLISQRYDTTEIKAMERFETAKATWQDKKDKLSESIMNAKFTAPDKLGISLAKLPQRLITPAPNPPGPEMNKTFTWWDRRLHYRVLVTMKNTVARPATGSEAFAYPVEIKLNFTELLKESGVSSSDIVHTEIDLQSVRVIEYSKEGTPIDEVPYQIGKTRHFDERFNAEANLVWIIRKPIETKSVKYFYVYFDTIKSQAPEYNIKYPYGGLSTSGTDQKGYWLKNTRLKIGINSPYSRNNTPLPSLINSWVIRDFSTGLFSNLNLVTSNKSGFGVILQTGPGNKLSLQKQTDGPLLTSFCAISEEGDGCVFNFYENLPICEVFTDSRIREFHNSYQVPQSYLVAALKDKMSVFSGAEYLSSNYTRGNIPADNPIGNLQSNDSHWLAQRIVKGLTIAAITPEKGVTHYLKTTPEDSSISISFGVAGAKPFHHFIIYADTTEEDTFDLLNRIKNVFTLDNPPVIQRQRTEKLPP